MTKAGVVVAIIWSLGLFFEQVKSLSYQQGSSEDSVNETLLIIIDRRFMPPKYRGEFSKVKEIISESLSATLKDAAISIVYLNSPDISNTRDVVAVFSVASCLDTWKIYNSAREGGIIFISLTESDCPRLPVSEGLTIPLVELGGETSQLLLDLRTFDYIDWKSALFIYEESIDNGTVKNMIDSLTKAVSPKAKSCDLILYKVPSSDVEWERNKIVSRIMSQVPERKKQRNNLFMGSSTMITPIWQNAKTRKQTGPMSRWLFIVTDLPGEGLNISTLAPLIDEGENIAFIYNATDTQHKCMVGTIMQLEINRESGVVCHVEETMRLLGEALATNLKEEQLLASQLSGEEWDAIRPTKDQRRESLLTYFANQLRTRGKCGNCSSWLMETSQSWGRSFTRLTKPLLLQIGYWTPTTGPVLHDHLFPHVAHGFRAVQLPIATFNSPPWQTIIVNESGHETYHGVVFEIISELALRLNFTYTIINLSNSISGTNGSKSIQHKGSANDSLWTMGFSQVDTSEEIIVWNKTLNAIGKKQVFLGGIGFTITDEREAEANFTSYIAIEPYVFLVSRPKYLTRALLFLQPFTSDTWVCIIIAIVVISPLLHIIHNISPFYEHYESRSACGFHKMINCFWYVYGALLQQGGGNMPTADSGRLVIGTWWLVVLVLVTTYCGNLVAFLTFPRRDSLISNVDELLERRDFLTWGMPAISLIHSILSKTNNEKLEDLSEGAKLHEKLTEEVIAEVREGRHVYIDRKSKLLYLMKSEFLKTGKCHFAIGDEQFLEEKLAMIVGRDNPYVELINREIVRMHKVGLINKWIHDNLPERDKCWGSLLSKEADNHKVNLDDMQGSFFLLFFGVAIAMFLILFEFLYKKWRHVQDKTYVRPFVS